MGLARKWGVRHEISAPGWHNGRWGRGWEGWLFFLKFGVRGQSPPEEAGRGRESGKRGRGKGPGKDEMGRMLQVAHSKRYYCKRCANLFICL